MIPILVNMATALTLVASVMVIVEIWSRRYGVGHLRFRIGSIAILTCWLGLYIIITGSLGAQWWIHLVYLAQSVIICAAGAVSWCAWRTLVYITGRVRHRT